MYAVVVTVFWLESKTMVTSRHWYDTRLHCRFFKGRTKKEGREKTEMELEEGSLKSEWKELSGKSCCCGGAGGGRSGES